jgi:hypothetical protein
MNIFVEKNTIPQFIGMPLYEPKFLSLPLSEAKGWLVFNKPR